MRQLITPPKREPISLAQAKAHMKVDTSDDDELIQALITASRQYVESNLNRALVEQTWELWLERFPRNYSFDIPLPPLQSVASIKYYGTDNTEYTMASTDYLVDAVSYVGRVVLAYGKSWPSVVLRPGKGVCVRFTAGYETYSSIVDTISATVSKASGDDFDVNWTAGKGVVINGVTHHIAAVASSSSLTVSSVAGTNTGVAFTADDIPQTIKQAMFLLIGHWFNNREAVVVGTISKEIEFAVNSLLYQNRIHSV